MKAIMMYRIILITLIINGAVACDSGNSSQEESDPTALIAGQEMKTWRIKKEVSDVGFRERTTDVERSQEITFYTGSTFVISSDSQTRGGRWTYSSDTLTLQFNDNGELRIYEVENLQENRMRLKGYDGDEVVFVTRDDK